MIQTSEEYIPQFEPWIDGRELEKVTECIRDNWITGGKKVREFEERIAVLCSVRRAVACCNGTVALFMALKALQVGQTEGDEVIVPDFTFIASANSVTLAGAKPVFVDVDKGTLNIDPGRLEEAITDSTRAIMPVHIYGQAADVDSVMRLAEKHNLFVIEDAAQGIGVSWKGKPVGGLGHAGCLSFYADKTLTCGEGGMVLTNNDLVANTCLRLSHQSNLGKGQYIHETVGYNFRLTDLQAAVGLAQLEKLPEIVNRKRANESLYRSLLAGVPGVEFPTIDERAYNVPFRVVVFVDDPSKLLRYLEQHRVGAKRVFYPLHRQPCYRGYRLTDALFPNSVWAYEHGLALPSSAKLTQDQIERVCQHVREFLCS